ncbi:winged helix DNA-binding protein [Parapontixanthobacter aurantiacus]
MPDIATLHTAPAELSKLPSPGLIRRVIRQRQERSALFEADLFADPAWDMLLDLAAAHAEGQRVSVTSLCIASGVPTTTALRWIAQLTAKGLVEKVQDAIDRRRAFVRLTDRSIAAIARYFRNVEPAPAL